ncbi:galactokinase [Lentiprolixibacter aurantiacus]|uniref:Galactokinase n=1 Tax=Lentiprolixibacter aurantiacus TaxID=2993939 RepID=A0AAE3MKH1_9FLAO|nr:galactokinase [Lentiprolixibacter aurantiacus]MCX2718883.1 galactokinase [Lentiprolixibacter aurantiacus]
MQKLLVKSPGRINLIGEHTDYNDGFVLPTAIDKTIDLTFSRLNSEHLFEVYSKDLGKSFRGDLRKIKPQQDGWENYVLGVIAGLQKESDKLRGFSCTLQSDIPIGSGVSSSAALECGIAFGLNEFFKLGLDSITLVELAQKAEHDFVGTQCGIMDQFASVMSRSGHVILLDCRSLDYSFVPLEIGNYCFLLVNSHVHHSLASTEYNTRREQCAEVVEIINKTYPQVTSLRDVNKTMLDDQRSDLPELLYRRAKFVVEENYRVLEAVSAIRQGDLDRLGALLYQSHHGLQYEYEVSCPEIDFLVEFTRDYPGILGSRIMGGGFGGCSLNLIHRDRVTELVDQLAPAYREKFGKSLSWFVAKPSGGAAVSWI